MIYIKSQEEIDNITKACDVFKQVRQALIQNTKPNKSLKELDQLAKRLINSYECDTPFHNYRGFPGYICISVNDTIIHGIATDYKLKDGDLITYDVGVSYKGYICDSAFSYILGRNEQAEKISKVCLNSLYEGIKQIKPNNRVGDISNAIQTYVESNGYFVLEDFGGHGCGKMLHEDPIILNYGKPNTGPLLKKNMVLCIEPMILTGSNEYYIDKDRWSVKAVNKQLTCHWEHMVLVTENGYKILTE